MSLVYKEETVDKQYYPVITAIWIDLEYRHSTLKLSCVLRMPWEIFPQNSKCPSLLGRDRRRDRAQYVMCSPVRKPRNICWRLTRSETATVAGDGRRAERAARRFAARSCFMRNTRWNRASSSLLSAATKWLTMVLLFELWAGRESTAALRLLGDVLSRASPRILVRSSLLYLSSPPWQYGNVLRQWQSINQSICIAP